MNTNSKEIHGRLADELNANCILYEDMVAKLSDAKIYEKQKKTATDNIKKICQNEADIVETVKSGIKDFETTNYLISFSVSNLDKTELDVDLLRRELEKHNLGALIDLCQKSKKPTVTLQGVTKKTFS